MADMPKTRTPFCGRRRKSRPGRDIGRKEPVMFEILAENAGFIRHELSKVLHIRTVPELRFIVDGSMEYGMKIDSILSKLEKSGEDD